MGYVRDNKTGKFSWVEGTLDDDDGPYVKPGGRRKSETNPKMLLIALLVVAVVAGVAVWGRVSAKEPSIPIRRIHDHPADFDGRDVIVSGQVASVFQVGGSYAYYLREGRDTIVVFTRGERPKASGNRRVHGSVSIGYLDGLPRPALFEHQ